MKRTLTILLCTLCCAIAMAQDSIRVHRSFLQKVIHPFEQFFAGVDTNYIEPSHYNFQAMVLNNISVETYRISDENGNSIRFSPEPSLKVGPYGGWGLIFLGWTIDLKQLAIDDNRKEFDLSLYTLPIGIDLFYRQSGNNYHISDYVMNSKTYNEMIGRHFNGFNSSVKGANLYYIFNHNRFSYPAAFNQSTKQKASCGSALAGLGFTRHTLKIDWQELNNLTNNTLGNDVEDSFNDDLLFEKVTYTDISASGGYAYNWVFSKNWLFAASLALALSYKHTISDTEADKFSENVNFRDFRFDKLTLDGVGRFGIVWNNNRWFAGASAILNSYNYSSDKFTLNNHFGYINIYAGVNFW